MIGSAFVISPKMGLRLAVCVGVLFSRAVCFQFFLESMA